MSEEKVTEAKIEEVGPVTKDAEMKISKTNFNEIHKLNDSIGERHRRIGMSFTNMMRMAADVERDNQSVQKVFVECLKEAGISEENFEQYQIDLQSGEIIKRK